jgi:hypothetical protein
MNRSLLRLKTLVARLWQSDPLLTGTGLLLLAALLPSLAGLWIDPRTIMGAPAWLKPSKFAVSTAIYTLTLAWVFTYLPAWPKTRRLVSRTTAMVMAMEVAIIDVQAWRGTTSHFNVGVPLDAVLYSVMGAGITLQTLASVAVAVALWRQAFADRALGWALRLGMSLTIAGASTGGLMTRPTGAQLELARATHRMTVAGAHTVGAPDGGPGMPATGWSTLHGDIRVPHFLGLHALQALPLITLLFNRRRWSEAARVRLTLTAAASYGTLFAILLWQALGGHPLIHPDSMAASVFAMWAVLTAAAMWISASGSATAPTRAAMY